MAHPAQREFCLEVKQRFPDSFVDNRVLEIGSRNVNGSFREEFSGGDYIGVDVEPGPGVDVVCYGHDYEAPPASFDTVFTTETLEHDRHAKQTLQRMLDLLKPDGLLFGTCAGEGRAEHGTRRTGRHYGPDPDFYRNVSVGQFLEWMVHINVALRDIVVRHNPQAGDLYFSAVKA